MGDGTPNAGEATGTIEITLTGLDGRPLEHDGGDPDGVGGDAPPPPNWRRLVGLASLAGVVLGLAVAVLVLDGDEGDPPVGEPPSTPVVSRAISDITTPPTLTPLTDLPPPDFATRGTLSTAPQGTTSQTIDLFLRHRYPRSSEVPADGRFELEPAIAGLAEDRPRLARTHLELGENGYTLDTTIVRDPANDRYEITLTVEEVVEQRLVVDVAGGSTYLRGDEGWVAIPNGELLAGTDTTEPREFFDRLLLGPLRPDTLDAASTEPGSYVSLQEMVGREAVVAREYTVVLPGAMVPEWQLYIFSPIAEFSPADRPDELTYTAYVSEVGELGNVLGTALVGDIAQRVAHSIETLDPPITVELPHPDEVVERSTGSR